MTKSIDNSDHNSPYEGLYYGARQFGAFLQETIRDAIPGTLLVKTLVTAATYFYPSIACKGVDRDTFIVTHKNKEDVAKKIIEKRVSFAPSLSEQDKASQIPFLLTTFTNILTNRLATINSLAQKMGLTRTIKYAISMHDGITHPYASVGDRFSPGDPLVNAVVPSIIIGAQGTPERHSLTPSSEAIKARQSFIIAHEIAHIAKNDHLTRLLMLTGMALLNISLWISGLGVAASLATRIVSTALAAGLSHGSARFFYTLIVREQERKADLLAIQTLHSAEGAKTLFSAIPDNPRDLEHPSNSERLAMALRWTPP